MPVLRGIGHRLLRDAVQVQRVHGFESAIQRVVRLATHVDVEHRRQAAREFLERQRQAAAIEGHRRQAARQRARREDGVVDQQRDFLDRRRQRRRLALGAILEAAQQQRDAGELLAEAVVQVVADALLLAVADLEHFALELPPRGGVLQHRQPEALAAQHQRGDGRFDEQRACRRRCAPCTVSSLTSGAPARAAASSADSAMRRSSGGSQGSWLEVLADERAGDDAEHAIEGRVGHADDAAAVGQHHAFVHHLDGQRLAAQHFFVGLAVRDVVHHADEPASPCRRRDDRLVGQVDPARLAAQRLQRQLHLGAFAACAAAGGAGWRRRDRPERTRGASRGG